MKSRKTLMTLGVIVAVLILGVGYATISSIELNINGTAAVITSQNDFKVQFDTDGTVETSTDATIAKSTTETVNVVTGAYTNETTATMTVNLNSDNRTATATYTIENLSTDLSANLVAEVTQVSGTYADYFNVTQTLASSTVAAGASTTIVVQVDLKKVPATDIDAQTFTVKITASPVVAA